MYAIVDAEDYEDDPDFVDEVVDDLGVRSELGYIREIIANGTGADRQLRVWNETKDLNAVVDYIVAETEHGLPLH